MHIMEMMSFQTCDQELHLRLIQQREYKWFHIRKHQLYEDSKFCIYEPKAKQSQAKYIVHRKTTIRRGGNGGPAFPGLWLREHQLGPGIT
ncbi:hypothetical protein PVAP13_6KG305306 [Panicum virgatum]|uniref:Uncharacterized protein n=1 Tax=Panicum virgatum TaxID=38727 RepID=A0A8T0REJ6_PANVG|nr:hypothetical protein PVAP13_6KG305306 [Panicum virgatum]